jgi:hypothetical protein
MFAGEGQVKRDMLSRQLLFMPGRAVFQLAEQDTAKRKIKVLLHCRRQCHPLPVPPQLPEKILDAFLYTNIIGRELETIVGERGIIFFV